MTEKVEFHRKDFKDLCFPSFNRSFQNLKPESKLFKQGWSFSLFDSQL